MRNMRVLEFFGSKPLSEDEAKKLNTSLLSAKQRELFEAKRDFDCALAMEGVAGTYRIVPEKVRSPAELGFKNIDVITKLLSYHNGLILVTSPVGAGKTTTLNSLIDVFPPNEQSQIRAMVAESLRGIICQRLLPAVAAAWCSRAGSSSTRWRSPP